MSGFASTALGRILAQGQGISHTGDTTETALATIALPPLGPNDRIEVRAQYSCTNNANTKTARARLGGIGGTLYATGAMTTSSCQLVFYIQNKGATNSQEGSSQAASGSAAPIVTSALDTTTSQNLVLSGLCNTSAADTITLSSYQVILYPKG